MREKSMTGSRAKGRVKSVADVTRVTLAGALLICLITGCAGSVDTVPGAGSETEGEVAVDTGTLANVETDAGTDPAEGSPEQDFTESAAGERPGAAECPEGYVYDYQVSMEPIPEEIAALGGPCQGTVHAFPSKIGMALTELEMEEDPVLKEEVEKRIPEIEAALEEEIGGEFAVDGVILSSDFFWVFFCTEVATGYQFELNYANCNYYAKKHNEPECENYISVDSYYFEKESLSLREDLLPILEEVYSDGSFMVRTQIDAIDIIIAQYTEEKVNKEYEQKRLLMVWEKLKEYDDTLSFNLGLIFYPSTYRDMIEEKFTTPFRYDFDAIYSDEIASCLAEKNDIWCRMKYFGRENKEDKSSLDVLLQQYKEGKYKEEIIWDYWLP